MAYPPYWSTRPVFYWLGLGYAIFISFSTLFSLIPHNLSITQQKAVIDLLIFAACFVFLISPLFSYENLHKIFASGNFGKPHSHYAMLYMYKTIRRMRK